MSEGWCQIEFDEPKMLHRIISVQGMTRGAERYDYEIQGSMDGKTWYKLVPKRRHYSKKEWLYTWTDDKLAKPVKAKFVRTYRSEIFFNGNTKNDAVLYEQYFNPEDVPQVLYTKAK